MSISSFLSSFLVSLEKKQIFVFNIFLKLRSILSIFILFNVYITKVCTISFRFVLLTTYEKKRNVKIDFSYK